jgi:hypothetical protein
MPRWRQATSTAARTMAVATRAMSQVRPIPWGRRSAAVNDDDASRGTQGAPGEAAAVGAWELEATECTIMSSLGAVSFEFSVFSFQREKPLGIVFTENWTLNTEN